MSFEKHRASQEAFVLTNQLRAGQEESLVLGWLSVYHYMWIVSLL